jgi:hypothetical protein
MVRILALVLMFVGCYLQADAGLRADYNTFCVEFKPSEDQRQRIVKCEIGPSQVRDELSQPLSTEKLEELERVAGVRLYDENSCAWGRWLRLEHGLPIEELNKILDKLRTLPYVSRFKLENNTFSGIPRWAYREYWLTPEEVASGQFGSCEDPKFQSAEL